MRINIFTRCCNFWLLILIKHSIRIALTVAFIIIGATDAMAIEEAVYTVVEKDKKFEIRDYASHILAETLVEGSLEGAGNKAFKILFAYISGDNRSGKKMAMTAPVSQQPKGEAPCSRKVGRKLHDAVIIHSEDPSRAGEPKYHLASGSSSTDGRRALFRFLEREAVSSIQVGTGIVDSRKRPYHCGRSHMGPIQFPLYPLVLAPKRDSDSDRHRYRY